MRRLIAAAVVVPPMLALRFAALTINEIQEAIDEIDVVLTAVEERIS